MTQDDIVRMAREAGGAAWPYNVVFSYEEAARFAALVAADEREACARVCDRFVTLTHQHEEQIGPGSCAAAIRARGRE